MRVAIDTGGTFTDVLLELDDGRLLGHKRPSTPDDPGQAVLDGICAALAEAGVAGGPLEAVLHGTTVGTNALLERRGARVLLVATRGFEDILELGRQARPELYALHVAKVPALVRAGDAIGARERLGPDGAVSTPLDAAALEETLDAIAERLASSPTGEEEVAVAICLLHAYANEAREQQLEAAIAERFGERLAVVCRSSTVLAEVREYERASTTVANAFIAPRVARYVKRLASRLGVLPEASGARLRIMQSNGGLMSAGEAAAYPIQTALSGPAGGVLGALASARAAGFSRVVTFDMGGTSSDVGFCAAGRVQLGSEGAIGAIPVRIPMVDLHTVGAGGGSIARIDAGGALKVGPESAGAVPGPACYGRGGVRPTVSDAHVVLGRLCPEHFLGGAMRLDVEAARRAVFDHVARPLGVSLEEAAAGILAVVDASMARAVRVMSVERGQVPGELALVVFGGAGALHGCALAEAVGIPRVVVPARPGLLSAYGMLQADVVRFVSRSLVCSLGVAGEVLPGGAVERVRAVLEALRGRCHALLAQDGIGSEARALVPEGGLRYRGQSYELVVGLSPGESVDAAVLEALKARFEAAHEARYGYRMAGHAVELVTLRVQGIGRVARRGAAAAAAPVGAGAGESVRAWFAGTWREVERVSREAIAVGSSVDGPAIVTEYTATTVVAPGWRARLEAGGALVLERAQGEGVTSPRR